MTPTKTKQTAKSNYEVYGGRRDWTTQDECDWLGRIGDTADISKPRPRFAGQPKQYRTKRELLTSYIDNIQNRYNWGEVDRDTVMAHAKWLLSKLDKGVQ